MQVSKAKLTQFINRILSEYRESDAFLTLKKSKKYGDRQRESSIAVLSYILEKGGDSVRRRELRQIFCLGGEQRDRCRLSKSLKDNELQRILDRLLIAGFIERIPNRPHSKRTKGRNIPDNFYRFPLVRIHFDEMEGSEDLDMDALRRQTPYSDESYRQWLLGQVRSSLTEKLKGLILDDQVLIEFIKFWGCLFNNNFSNDEEKKKNQLLAVRQWATSLPDTKRNLRSQVINFIEAEDFKRGNYLSPQAFHQSKET